MTVHLYKISSFYSLAFVLLLVSGPFVPKKQVVIMLHVRQDQCPGWYLPISVDIEIIQWGILPWLVMELLHFSLAVIFARLIRRQQRVLKTEAIDAASSQHKFFPCFLAAIGKPVKRLK